MFFSGNISHPAMCEGRGDCVKFFAAGSFLYAVNETPVTEPGDKGKIELRGGSGTYPENPAGWATLPGINYRNKRLGNINCPPEDILRRLPV